MDPRPDIVWAIRVLSVWRKAHKDREWRVTLGGVCALHDEHGVGPAARYPGDSDIEAIVAAAQAIASDPRILASQPGAELQADREELEMVLAFEKHSEVVTVKSARLRRILGATAVVGAGSAITTAWQDWAKDLCRDLNIVPEATDEKLRETIRNVLLGTRNVAYGFARLLKGAQLTAQSRVMVLSIIEACECVMPGLGLLVQKALANE